MRYQVSIKSTNYTASMVLSLHPITCGYVLQNSPAGNQSRSSAPFIFRTHSPVAGPFDFVGIPDRRRRTWKEVWTKRSGGASLGGGNAILWQCAVEQRLARQAHNLEVVGSIPTVAIFPTSQSDRRPPPNPPFRTGGPRHASLPLRHLSVEAIGVFGRRLPRIL